METLSRRINSTFGSLASLKNKHNRSMSSGPSSPEDAGSLSPEVLINRMECGGGGGMSTTTGGGAGDSIKQISGHNRSASGASTQSGIGAPSLSISMNSVSSEGSSESHLVEQEEIVALTQEVRGFKEALSRLRRIFHPDREKLDNLRASTHERLGEVLRILRAILEKYPLLQSTELLMAAGQLIQQVKDYKYEDHKVKPTEFFESIDQLALAFSSRVSEYLMGDIDTLSIHPLTRARSCENIVPAESDNYDGCGTAAAAAPVTSKETSEPQPPPVETLTSDEIDDVLMKLDCGVNIALHRAKVWSKYAKDVMNYIEKRAALEAEHSRNLEKLAQNVKAVFKDESFLPFQSIYWTALDQDIENANFCQATCTLLKEHKFIEPLSARRAEHEKQRKQIKEAWQRECKKTQEAVCNLRKARGQYIQKNLEYEKAKESVLKVENSDTNEASKLDKKRRLEEDALLRVVEAELQYKSCVDIANERHHIQENAKAMVLRQVRELMLQCDQTMKAATVCYFQLQHTISAQAPIQFQALYENSRLYEPGSQYMEFVKTLPVPTNPVETSRQPFTFEPYVADNKMLDKERKSVDSCETLDESIALPQRLAEGREKLRVHHTAKVWSPAVTAVLGSDSDSIGSSQSNRSRDTSPSASPQGHVRRVASHGSSGDELDVDIDLDRCHSYPSVENGYGTSPRKTCLSKAAASHFFRKLKTLAKCRECDTYVYFQGVECSQCGLTSHKKCLETLAIQCGHKRLPRRMTTFGVDLASHLHEAQITIPHLVEKCVSEIDRRGSQIKGIYRVSGVKSRVEKLCQSFENGANLVDLSDIHPNVIANVLKLYLRQLPEPLLTFRLYPEFIRIAKEYQAKQNKADEKEINLVLKDLKDAVNMLPPLHRSTLFSLMSHLRRVSESCGENNMPPSNLGIVFGPTLLRSSEGGASLTSLMDTVHQAKVVELLIVHADVIFSGDHWCVNGDKDRHSSNSTEEIDLESIKAKPETAKNPQVDSAAKCGKSYVNTQSQNPEEWSRMTPTESIPLETQTQSVATMSSPPPQSFEKNATEAAVTENVSKGTTDNGQMKTAMLLQHGNVNASSGTTATSKSTGTMSNGKQHSDKVKAAMCGVATQTDLSFLRNLAAAAASASPAQTLRKHGNIPTSQQQLFASLKQGQSVADTMDKIMIHVAGPGDKNEFLGQRQDSLAGITTNGEQQILNPCPLDVKIPLAPVIKSPELEDTNQKPVTTFDCGGEPDDMVVVESLKETGTDAKNPSDELKKEDNVMNGTSKCGDEDADSQRATLNNQINLDSGLDEARISPHSLPSHYVSPYLNSYSYRAYRYTSSGSSSSPFTPKQSTNGDLSPKESFFMYTSLSSGGSKSSPLSYSSCTTTTLSSINVNKGNDTNGNNSYALNLHKYDKVSSSKTSDAFVSSPQVVTTTSTDVPESSKDVRSEDHSDDVCVNTNVDGESSEATSLSCGDVPGDREAHFV